MTQDGDPSALGPRSVVIGEPLALVRAGLAALCEMTGEYFVVQQCEDGETALLAVESHRPDFAVLDLELERLFTLEVIRRIRSSKLPARIVVLGLRTDRKTVMEVLRSGASAYVLKSGPAGHLFDALRQIGDGGVYISPLLNLEKIFMPPRKLEAQDPLDALSRREYQVFTLLVEGVRAKEIAARLGVSPKTVDTYRSSLMRKLDIHDVAGLVKYAIRRQFITSA